MDINTLVEKFEDDVRRTVITMAMEALREATGCDAKPKPDQKSAALAKNIKLPKGISRGSATRVIKAIRSIGGEPTSADVASRMGVEQVTAGVYLSALKSVGLVTSHRMEGRNAHAWSIAA
jgi:response regulator of citrate/malate metabolism